MRRSPARALSIAGSDSGGGAGIQADLKTFTALRVFGMTAVTAVTAQNTVGVQAAFALAPDLVLAQIAAVRDDLGVDATKTGMLANAPIISAVSAAIRRGGLGPVVVDPVMRSKGGVALLEAEAAATLRAELIPLASVLTPNLPEAAALLGCDLGDLADGRARREAAVALRSLGAEHVVLKGGHLAETHGGRPPEAAVDLWFDGSAFVELTAPWVDSRHTHGTGCTFSASLAALLARGASLAAALHAAKAFTTWAIQRAPGLGRGSGPLNHLGSWPPAVGSGPPVVTGS